ncbi:MAG: aminotransferase class III-fold pyridoxal phosphate-dependent enzyme [Planctomycetota bacterium]|jgi:4-aminobutyrate aminotransferase-like enzyme/Ser/Thr protein kinase RdoA (MazF antagonist)
MSKMPGFQHIKPNRPKAPALEPKQAEQLAAELFGVKGRARPLPSYIDQNFLVEVEDGGNWVLKIANAAEEAEILDFQNRAMDRLEEIEPGIAPAVCRSRSGRQVEAVEINGVSHLVRVVSYLDGPLLADARHICSTTWESLGHLLGRVDRALDGLSHGAMHRELRWDLAHADWTIGFNHLFSSAKCRRLVQYFQLQFAGHVKRRLSELPQALIYNDPNDRNIVVDDQPQGAVVTGIFDLGDLVHTARIFELAVACAYAILDRDDPLKIIGRVVKGYNGVIPLADAEYESLFPAVCMRLAVSVTVSALDAQLEPENEYIRVTEAPAWRTLERLAEIEPEMAEKAVREACKVVACRDQGLPKEKTLELRQRHLGLSLSLNYREPLEIVRGRMQYLFDKSGRAYLDCVNNVCHVGHCHPKVVEAAQRQIETLNTNTRYLHDNIVLYAERLAALLPNPLSVCFFVNSGSEANELALRLARTFTGRYDMIALKMGYHGHTSSLVDLSPYKHDGPGGSGPPEWVHQVPCPDTYRGLCREDDPDAATKYASHVSEAFDKARRHGREFAGFIAEPLIGCGGQIVPPEGYLREAFAHVRSAGGVCIADEVQIGFGRVGTHMWAFEAQGAVPDIVTLGKPIGNGHPLAADITTPEIAAAFDNGMEFFSTFGGNPVSCAVGLAVLDVIESEGLQEHALQVGQQLVSGFCKLADHHEPIGNVRGQGLYIGVELVTSRETRTPAPDLLASAIELSRDTGVLLSSDGPDHNVLKIKPPMPFTQTDADLLLQVFDRALQEAAAC